MLHRFPRKGDWINRRDEVWINIIEENIEESNNYDRKTHRVYIAKMYSLQRLPFRISNSCNIFIPNHIEQGSDKFINEPEDEILQKIMIEVI